MALQLWLQEISWVCHRPIRASTKLLSGITDAADALCWLQVPRQPRTTRLAPRRHATDMPTTTRACRNALATQHAERMKQPAIITDQGSRPGTWAAETHSRRCQDHVVAPHRERVKRLPATTHTLAPHVTDTPEHPPFLGVGQSGDGGKKARRCSATRPQSGDKAGRAMSSACRRASGPPCEP
jgi:hypothetical protein